MSILARIVIVVGILCVVMMVGYVTMGDSATAVAIRQWFMGIFRASFEPVLNWLSRFVRRAARRQVTNFIWRITAGIVIALVIRYYFKGTRWPLYRRFARIRILRNKVIRTLTTPFRWEPPIPRWMRACVGVIVAGLVIWLCYLVNPILFDETWTGWFGSLFFAVVVFYVVEQLPVLGFDSLLAIISERGRWMKEHPRIASIVGGKTIDKAERAIIEKLSKKSAH